MRIFYAQSGGVTSVINTTCAGLLKAAQKENIEVLIGLNGIHGVFDNRFISSKTLTSNDIDLLSKTPGGSFGSCRYKVQESDHDKIISFIEQHHLNAFIYHGGNDSMDTCHKISELCKDKSIECLVIGLPKTIDNDLYGTDQCPGFGSSAKYLNVSFDEASLDIASMCRDSTKVFILETMGRHAGWLAASCGLTQHSSHNHLLLIPEKSYQIDDLAQRIQDHIHRSGFCTISLSEGVKLPFSSGSENVFKDAFGHSQLGGIGFSLLKWLKDLLKIKSHLAVSDYLQRSAGHCMSKVDFEQAFSLGKNAVQAIKDKQNGVMLAIKRESSVPYKWSIQYTPLSNVANKERLVPDEYLTSEHKLSRQGKEYFAPLIHGEVPLEWSEGLPVYWPHRLRRN